MYKNAKITTPVVLIIFNRPEPTKLVFQEIRNVKPSSLYVIADGPRKTRPGENESCKLTRDIIETIDWECEVYKNYSDVNLGLKKRIESGLDWVFEKTEEAIILEDDCLPHPTFFQFCQELLHYYSKSEKIMMISGGNFFPQFRDVEYSYYFSAYYHVWGWASWRRAWKHFDSEMKDWLSFKDGNYLKNITGDEKSASYLKTILQEVYEGKINSWAYKWLYACWLQNGLSIVPSKNLISNIGDDWNATHSKRAADNSLNIPTEAIQFPLKHPVTIERNLEADMFETKKWHRFRGRDKFIRIVKSILKL